MAKLSLGPDEWIGYCGCTVEEAVKMFRRKYRMKDVEVLENCVILVRPRREK